MKYELTPEHRAQLEPWAQRWIANAMSTEPMTEQDKAACVEAVHGLYAAADLPPPKHVVFVPSPFVLAFAGGFAAAIWHASRHGWPEAYAAAAREATTGASQSAAWAARTTEMQETGEFATTDVTMNATAVTTRAATRAAMDTETWDEMRVATSFATYVATTNATTSATRAATTAATSAAEREATADAMKDAAEAATSSATWDATEAATRDATRDATRAATADATWSATQDATWGATGDATGNATWAATEPATARATEDAAEDAAWWATRDAAETAGWSAWYEFPCDVRALADQLGVGGFGLACAAQAWRMWQRGNQWSGYDAFISFFQDIAKLPLDYSKYRHWRTLAERSGPRIVHPDFCMISDRPERLLVDEQNRPHCDDGPFCRWRDGSALYAVHGVRVPKQVVEAPETLTAEQVRAERNAEVRRVMLDRYGGLRGADAAGKWLEDIGAQPVDVDEAHGWLYRAELENDEPLVMLRVTCPSTGRVYFLRVPPEMQTAREARAWTFGKDPATFAPEAET